MCVFDDEQESLTRGVGFIYILNQLYSFFAILTASHHVEQVGGFDSSVR
jgi:hypothetical protein